jgi:hypothetical protein
VDRQTHTHTHTHAHTHTHTYTHTRRHRAEWCEQAGGVGHPPLHTRPAPGQDQGDPATTRSGIVCMYICMVYRFMIGLRVFVCVVCMCTRARSRRSNNNAQWYCFFTECMYISIVYGFLIGLRKFAFLVCMCTRGPHRDLLFCAPTFSHSLSLSHSLSPVSFPPPPHCRSMRSWWRRRRLRCV